MPAIDMRPASQRLREDTRDLHTRAEKSDFQAAMIQGRLEREAYVANLEQMLLVHQALESALRRHRNTQPAIARVVSDEQFQEPYLLEDLAFFGRDVSAIRPIAATERLIGVIEEFSQTRPLGLLGLHYVLEGSNNGNRFIARAVGKAYGLTGPGLRYLLPYGERQPQVWDAFKTNLEACDLGPDEADVLVDAAKAMFQGIIEIHEGLWEKRTS